MNLQILKFRLNFWQYFVNSLTFFSLQNDNSNKYWNRRYQKNHCDKYSDIISYCCIQFKASDEISHFYAFHRITLLPWAESKQSRFKLSVSFFKTFYFISITGSWLYFYPKIQCVSGPIIRHVFKSYQVKTKYFSPILFYSVYIKNVTLYSFINSFRLQIFFLSFQSLLIRNKKIFLCLA